MASKKMELDGGPEVNAGPPWNSVQELEVMVGRGLVAGRGWR
jgi:hypothetical protein